MSDIKKEVKSEVKKINIPKVGKLVLSNKVKEYIDCLHGEIGAIEWSGMLFYKLIDGNIKSMKDLVFQSDFIYPRDIGNASYTETEASSDVSDAYDIYEDGIECSVGLIHSHHSMSCFFSGTDTKELEDNAGLYNYYISLIVNFDGKYCAKIAFPGKQKINSVTTLIDSDGKPYDISMSGESDVIFIGDLDVEYNKESKGEEWLLDKIKQLQEAKKAKSIPAVNTSISWPKSGFTGQFEMPFDEFSSIKKTNQLKKKPTSKDLLAELIVCSPEANQSIDKTVFIAQDLKYNCTDKIFGEWTMECIEENFNDIYFELFGESTDAEFISILKGLSKELEMYEKTYSGSWFYEELKNYLKNGIEEFESEITQTKEVYVK